MLQGNRISVEGETAKHSVHTILLKQSYSIIFQLDGATYNSKTITCGGGVGRNLGVSIIIISL